MRSVIFLVFLSARFLLCAQSPNCPMGIPDTEPCFPGGPQACSKFIEEQIDYPPLAKESGLEGRVLLSFVVYCDGSVRDVMIMKSASPELDEEALRVFSLMPPWIPATIDGQTIQAKYTFPVSFSLPE